MPASLALFQEKQPPRVRPVIGFKKAFSFLHREMADLYDRVNVLGRNRRLICRVGNLCDEAAVLAERFGQTLAHAGRPPIDHTPKHSLIHPHHILTTSSLSFPPPP